MRFLPPPFRKEGGETEYPFAPALFQVLLAQNTPYAKVAYFQVTHSVTLHLFMHMRLYALHRVA